MRYEFLLLCVCVLGVVPAGGCNPLAGLDFSDPCEDIECPDDGNECTVEFCSRGPFEEGTCKSGTRTGPACDFDGLAGVCRDGQCMESPCGVCDDDDPCTEDWCSYVDERCLSAPVKCRGEFYDFNPCNEEMCNPLVGCVPVEDGTPCFPDQGVPYLRCQAGVCVGPCDPASEEILQCPTRESLFCCPGMKDCAGEC